MLEEGEGLSVSTGGSWFRVYGCLGHVNVHRRTGSCCLGRPRGDVGLATCGGASTTFIAVALNCE